MKPNCHRGHIQLDVVHETLVPCSPVHAGAPFEHDALNASSGKRAQRRSHRGVYHLERCARTFKGLCPFAMQPQRFWRCDYYHRSRGEGREHARGRRNA